MPSHKRLPGIPKHSLAWQRRAGISRSGWAAVLPPGGVQSTALRRRQRRARPQSKSQDQLRSPNLNSDSEIFWLPLSIISPQEPGDHRNPLPKVRNFCPFRVLGRFFRASKRASKLASNKHGNKCENRFGAQKPSPTPFKTASKTTSCKPHRFLSLFDSTIDLLKRKNLENINISFIKSMILKILINSTLSCLCSFEHKKTFQKH